MFFTVFVAPYFGNRFIYVLRISISINLLTRTKSKRWNRKTKIETLPFNTRLFEFFNQTLLTKRRLTTTRVLREPVKRTIYTYIKVSLYILSSFRDFGYSSTHLKSTTVIPVNKISFNLQNFLMVHN